MMTQDAAKRFEDFLVDSFGDGVMVRELRLSNVEVEYVLKKYPQASLKKALTPEYSDGKHWYEVSLLKPSLDEEDSIIEKKEEVITK